MNILKRLSKYPLLKGMTSYGVIWPTASVIQQTIVRPDNEKGGYDWGKVLRFGVWGSCYMAPTLYFWMKYLSKILPKRDTISSVKKTILEQFLFAPFSMSCFFFGMSAMENKSVSECVNEVQSKLFETWKVGLLFWPFVAMVTHAYISNQHKLTFYSTCSLVWTVFLAYMKSLQTDQVK